MPAATRANWRLGLRIVVSGGMVWLATDASSKPTSKTSSARAVPERPDA